MRRVLSRRFNAGERALLAGGGRGGRGNASFKTGRNNAPAMAEHGAAGSELWLDLELKLVADVGIVGVPNAGKSTLLSVVRVCQPVSLCSLVCLRIRWSPWACRRRSCVATGALPAARVMEQESMSREGGARGMTRNSRSHQQRGVLAVAGERGAAEGGGLSVHDAHAKPGRLRGRLPDDGVCRHPGLAGGCTRRRLAGPPVPAPLPALPVRAEPCCCSLRRAHLVYHIDMAVKT